VSAWTSQPLAKAKPLPSSAIKISMVQSCHHTETMDVSLRRILIAIREGRWRKEIETIRSFVFVGDFEQAEKLKNALPALMFRGRFSKRANDALLEYSGIIDADLDDVQDIEGTREKLMGLPQVLAIFRSPSGRGLKVLLKVRRDPARHPGNFRAVQKLILDATGIEIDRTPDLPRLCYVSYDPRLFLTEHATELEPLPEPEKPQRPQNNGEYPPDLSLRERVAYESLGPLAWSAEKAGYFCNCPGKSLHTTLTGKSHTIVYLDGVPTIKCQHNSCAKIVDAFNLQLRSAIAKAEYRAKPEPKTVEPSVDVDEPEIELPPAPASYALPPLDLLPQVLRDYVQAFAECLDVDESFVFLPLLASLGATIGNSRSILLKRDFVQPPVIWTAIIGRSGCKKSPSIDAGCLASMEHEHELRRQNKEASERYEDEVADWESASKKLRAHKPGKPVLRVHVTDDLTIETLADLHAANPRGLLVRKDEVSHWFASFDQYKSGKGSDVARWLTLHTAVFFAVDRRSDDRHYRIFDPRVCITGGIQPTVLERVLTPDFFERGLPARFLFAHPPFRQDKWSDATIPARLKLDALRLFDSLWLLAPRQDNERIAPEFLTLAPEAKAAFVAFYNATGRAVSVCDDREGAAWSKLTGYAARLALIGQLAHDPDATTICGEVMQAACKLAEWFGHEAARIYSELSETEEQRDLRSLIAFIKKRGGSVTVRDTMQSFRRLRNDRDGAERELHALVKGGLAKTYESKPAKGGWKTVIFKLTRVSTSTLDPRNTNEKPLPSVDVDTSSAKKITPSGAPEMEPVLDEVDAFLPTSGATEKEPMIL
jgi:hypothetical protein